MPFDMRATRIKAPLAVLADSTPILFANRQRKLHCWNEMRNFGMIYEDSMTQRAANRFLSYQQDIISMSPVARRFARKRIFPSEHAAGADCASALLERLKTRAHSHLH